MTIARITKKIKQSTYKSQKAIMFNLQQFIKTSVTGRQTSMFAPDIEADKDKLPKEVEGKSVPVIGVQ